MVELIIQFMFDISVREKKMYSTYIINLSCPRRKREHRLWTCQLTPH